jgi:hypothetical protein
MADVGKLYAKELHHASTYVAAWLPNINVKLGDVGQLKGELFSVETTLDMLGIPFTVRKGAKPVDFDYKSGISVKVKAAGNVAAGTTLPQAKAGISIQFDKEGAFLFQAAGCMVDQIENKAAVGNGVRELLEKKKWQPDWVVVDTVVRVDVATIFVSNSRSAALDLTAETAVTAANLADLKAGLSMNYQRGEVFRFIASEGLTPLFMLSGLKQSIIDWILHKPGSYTQLPSLRYGFDKTKEAFPKQSDETIEAVLKDLEDPLETVAPKWE